jgi:serine/threonine protein kinase
MQEVDILRSIRSDNVVAILEILESPNNYYIIQELCDSDLEHYILEHKELSEVRAISIMSEIAAGFTELVREGIIHR